MSGNRFDAVHQLALKQKFEQLERHGLTKREVALALRANETSVTLWINGKRPPNLWVFAQLWHLLAAYPKSFTEPQIIDRIRRLVNDLD